MDSHLSIAAIILGLALPALAAAQQSVLPPPTTVGNVTYISGGVGSDESLAMKQEQKNYPLSMVFSEGKRGAYLADVHVTVKDQGGKVLLDSKSNGPMMLVKLPPGEFGVTAQARGKAHQQSVKIVEGGTSNLVFNWAKDEKDPW